MDNVTTSEKQKWIYGSAALAFFSMFLAWRQLGIRSDTGWELHNFWVLLCWILPIIVAKRNTSNGPFATLSKVSIALGVVGLFGLMESDKSFELFSTEFTWKVGAGAYIYALAWGCGIYGSFFANLKTEKGIEKADADSQLYLFATDEFENNNIDAALWAKSLALSNGDESKAKYAYIRSRVAELQRQSKAETKGKQKLEIGNTINQYLRLLATYLKGGYGLRNTFLIGLLLPQAIFIILSPIMPDFLAVFIILIIFAGIIATLKSRSSFAGNQLVVIAAFTYCMLSTLVFLSEISALIG